MENFDLLMDKYKREMMELAGRAVNSVNEESRIYVNEAEQERAERQELQTERNPVIEEPQGQGRLKINVFTGNEAFPVMSATVEVYDGESLLFREFTDQSGAVSELTLPAPPAAISESPGKVKGYSTYRVRVSHPGFNSVELENVPVFEGITSVQPVSLEPKSSSGTEIITETEPFGTGDESYA